MNVYDFDNTIYAGDSTFDFYMFCLKRHKEILKLSPNLAKEFTKFAVLRRISKTEFKENMYSFLKYIDLEKDLKDFWDTHKNRIKMWYYIKQRDDDVIISASPEFLLKPICKELGIKHLIASKVDPKTGKYIGINCSGEEKVRRFEEIFGDAEIDEFYSDSYSDMPLVKRARLSNRIKGENFCKW